MAKQSKKRSRVRDGSRKWGRNDLAERAIHQGTAPKKVEWLERPTTPPSRWTKLVDYFSCPRDGNERIVTFIILPMVVLATCVVIFMVILKGQPVIPPHEATTHIEE